MKRFLVFALSLASLASWAQSGVLDIHPESNREGRILTQEEATLGINLKRPGASARWDESGKIVYGGYAERKPFKGVYSKGGSLYLTSSQEEDLLVCKGGNGIVYGETVSRNEFGINGGIFPAPDGVKTAFYRKDESRVTDFPLLDINTRTGELRNIKYPMNGMVSERISLGVYDSSNGSIVYMDVTDFDEERYLTNISWGPDSRYIFIQVLNREQHEMHLNMYRADDGKLVSTLLTEKNDCWVEPETPLEFIGKNYEFIYRTDNRDGYKNLYLCDTLGHIRRITPCSADVEYVSFDGKYVYYMSAEVSPAENHLFRIGLKKGSKPQRLTPERGWHRVQMSPDGKQFIDQYSSFNNPGRCEVRSCNGGKLIETLYDIPDPLEDFAQCEVDFGTVKSADGAFENHYRLFKPLGFDPEKKYPVILYVYGGPHSQMVQDRYLGGIRLWEMYMAQRGYVVYVQDNRGTPNHGAAYEKAINRACGQAEMADQMVGIRMLMSQPWVDSSRIGVHGWSYGGFMTISLLTTYPEVFKVGVAGGPVIDWKWYEVMYGERYMDTEASNPEGFAKTSLINAAERLQGKLLICQGAIDNTVVWEHSLSFVQKCIELGIPLDYFPYPMSEHNVYGRWRIHLMDKVSDYFNTWL